MFTLATFIQHSTGSSSQSSQEGEEIKGIQTRRKEQKLSLFADDMILHIKKHQRLLKILLELIHELNKITVHKINMQKYVAFLSTNTELLGRQIKKPFEFIIT